jgi:hypothetical protein
MNVGYDSNRDITRIVATGFVTHEKPTGWLCSPAELMRLLLLVALLLAEAAEWLQLEFLADHFAPGFALILGEDG